MKKLKIKLAVAMMALSMVAGSFAGVAASTEAETVSAASINASKAKRIALRTSSTASSKAVAMDCYKTYKNGKNVYHVSFYKKIGSNQYRHYVYDISSRDGSVVKQNSKDYNIISASRAKEIAIDDSDCSSSKAKDKSADLDEEDGKLVWNVSFTEKEKKTYTSYDLWYGSYTYEEDDETDYNYTINAVTGHIIDSDEDDDDDD